MTAIGTRSVGSFLVGSASILAQVPTLREFLGFFRMGIAPGAGVRREVGFEGRCSVDLGS
jgi:hypothetical protein